MNNPPFNKKKSFHALDQLHQCIDQWFQEDIKKEWVEDIRSEFPDLQIYQMQCLLKSDFFI